MNKFCICKIGLGQSHTECISPQALGFFVFTTRTCVFCSQSVAFSAGQSRGILWDSFTTYRCGVKELTQTRAQPWANSALCSLSVGWLQLTRSKDGQHHRTGQVHKEMTAEILLHRPFWKWHKLTHAFLQDMLCKHVFLLWLATCSHSILMVLSHWELWWNTILWEPWLTVLFLRPAQEVENEIQVWPKDWERQLCPNSQRGWMPLALFNFRGQEISFKLHSNELLGFLLSSLQYRGGGVKRTLKTRISSLIRQIINRNKAG